MLDWIVSASGAVSKGLASLLMNPFLYIFLIVGWMQARKLAWFERKLFYRRLNRPFEQWGRALVHGLIGGVFASLLLFLIGATFQPFDLWAMAAISLLFSFFRIQSLSFALAAGCYAFGVGVVQMWSPRSEIASLDWFWERLSAADIASIVALASLAYLIESALIRVNRGRGATPLFLSGKRGRLVGAYQLQKIWVLPMFFAIPASAGAESVWTLPAWWPTISNAAAEPLAWIGFPIALGFSHCARSRLPGPSSRIASAAIFRFGLLLFPLAVLSKWSPLVGAFAGLLAFLGYPLLARLRDWRERNATAMFAPTGEGAVVLAVIPGSPAEKMGILPGDLIVKANGQKIADNEDLYPALQLNSAFCKMEVRNAEGHMKYVQRAIYDGEHHQLGLILAPDEKTAYYVDLKPTSIVQLFRQQMNRGA